MNQHQATYTQGSIFGHLSLLSMTSAVGLFAIFVVDLVDVFFISILGEATLAAAVGFAGVALFIGAAVCIGIAIAVATLVAQALGANDEEQARRLSTHGLIYSLFWTLPVTALTLYFAPELLSLIGAEGETLDLAVSYFRIVGASLPVLGFAMSATAILRSVGDPKRSMWSTLYGGIINAVLDPLFIFGLGWGLNGAAVASVISRVTVAGVALSGLVRQHDMLVKPSLPHFVADIKKLNTIAIPSLITNLSAPVGSAYATAQMARYGTDAVAAASVIGRITPVAFAGLFGLSGAVGPVASQNFGANQLHRVRETLIASLKFTVLYVIPVSILLFFTQDVLVGIFDLDGEAAALLKFYATFIVISYLLYGLQIAANPIFTSLQHPGLSTVSNMTRDIILTIPLITLLSGLFGAHGVLAGQAAANSIAGIAAFAGALWLTRRVEQGLPISFRLPGRHLLKHCHHHRAIAPGVQHRGH